MNQNGAETTSFDTTTPRRRREGRPLRIVMVPRLLVLAPRHPANTGSVITYKSKWRQIYQLRHDTPPTPRGSSRTNRNAAETTSFNTTTPCVHCQGRHLRIRIAPKILVLASRHPASTAKVDFWRRDVKILKSCRNYYWRHDTRVHCKSRDFWRRDVKILKSCRNYYCRHNTPRPL